MSRCVKPSSNELKIHLQNAQNKSIFIIKVNLYDCNILGKNYN